MNKLKIFVVVLLISLVAQTVRATEGSVDPIYKNVFENERVWVYELTFNPGTKWAIRKPFHEYLIYVLEGDEFSLLHPDTRAGARTAKAGKVLWFPAETHEEDQSKELMSESGADIAVEIQSDSPAPSQRPWKDDHYQKAENNGTSVVRVLVVEFK